MPKGNKGVVEPFISPKGAKSSSRDDKLSRKRGMKKRFSPA